MDDPPKAHRWVQAGKMPALPGGRSQNENRCLTMGAIDNPNPAGGYSAALTRGRRAAVPMNEHAHVMCCCTCMRESRMGLSASEDCALTPA